LRIKLCNYYGKIVGYSVTRIAGVTPRLHHPERLNGSFPAIYVANHASTLDAFLSIWLCPVGGCGVVKKESLRVPFWGQLYRLSGHLWIDRSDREQAISAMREAAEAVRRYKLGIWIMPEGTRSRDGRLLPFKKGFVHLAIATGLPVVPVVMHGIHKNWEKGKYTLRPMTADIEVLAPVDTSSWRAETAQAHAEQVHALFAEHLREDQKPLSLAAGADQESAG
jgi:1-acyl-sn-glycerol-3-phosphate acyltransferase